MVELVLAAAETVVQSPSTLQTWGPWGAVVIALGGPKGVAMVVSLLRGQGVNGAGKYNEEACKDRHAALKETQEKNDENYKYIRDRLDEIIKHLLEEK